MLIWTTRISPKKTILAAAVLALAVLTACLLAGRFAQSEEPEALRLTGNPERVEYLRSLGWEVEEEPVETLQFLLPKKLEEPYLTYNELQDAQGFDLSQYCGKQVARYTYAVLNYPDRPTGVQLNLYVCEEQPVAGDILCAGAEGFQDTIVYPGERGEGA